MGKYIVLVIAERDFDVLDPDDGRIHHFAQGTTGRVLDVNRGVYMIHMGDHRLKVDQSSLTEYFRVTIMREILHDEVEEIVLRTSETNQRHYGWYKTLPMPEVTAKQVLAEMCSKYGEANLEECLDGQYVVKYRLHQDQEMLEAELETHLGYATELLK